MLDLDLPGHGYSDGLGFDRIEPMADWIIQALDACGLKKATLVGHSMGSLVAFDASARYPDRVEKVVLVGTSIPMPVGDVLLDAATSGQHDAFEMMNVWGHSSSAAMGSCPTPGMWMMGMGLRLFEKSQPGIVGKDLTACNEYTAGLERAADVACPSLLILGQRDKMTPAKFAKAVADGIPDSRIVILPGSGHAMLAERPEEVLDALIEFI